MGENRTLMRKQGPEEKHGVERVSSTLKEGGFQRGEREQAKRVFLGKEKESMSGEWML